MERVQILIRVRAPAKRGIVGYRAVDVKYHVGTRHYRLRFPVALTLCVRAKGASERCEGRSP
jgi:hypothetical protein